MGGEDSEGGIGPHRINLLEVGAVVGTATTVTKLAVKGAVGNGKLAYRGTKATVSGTRRMLAGEPELYSIEADRILLPDPE